MTAKAEVQHNARGDWQLELQWRIGPQSAKRTAVAHSCAALGEATALYLALAIDAQPKVASTAPVSILPDRPQSDIPPPPPQSHEQPPVLPSQPENHGQGSTPPANHTEVVQKNIRRKNQSQTRARGSKQKRSTSNPKSRPSEPKRARQWSLGPELSGRTGLLAAFDFGVAVRGWTQKNRLRIGTAIEFVPPRRLVIGGPNSPAIITWAAGLRLDLCAVLGAVDNGTTTRPRAPRPRATAPLCASSELLVIAGHGRNAPITHNIADPWWAVGAGPGLELAWPRFRARLAVALLYGVLRPRFEIVGVPLVTPRAIAARLSLSLDFGR